MIRSRRLTMVGILTLISFGGVANAGAPNPADVEACNQEATAESAEPAAAPGNSIAPALRDQGTNSTTTAPTDEPQSDRSSVNGGQSSAPTAAARQAFAACLAKHGYYKGYYHH